MAHRSSLLDDLDKIVLVPSEVSLSGATLTREFSPDSFTVLRFKAK